LETLLLQCNKSLRDCPGTEPKFLVISSNKDPLCLTDAIQWVYLPHFYLKTELTFSENIDTIFIPYLGKYP
jgi:hypothetical protein